MMEKLEIKAADLLLKYGTPDKAVRTNYCLSFENVPYMTIEILNRAAIYLKKHEFVKMSELGTNKMYTLTPDGYDFAKKGVSFEEFLKQVEDKKAKQITKDELDEYYKNLQVRDLEEKLNTMNVEQRDFWKAQKQKNVQTTIIAIIGIVSSLIALLKSFGYLS